MEFTGSDFLLIISSVFLFYAINMLTQIIPNSWIVKSSYGIIPAMLIIYGINHKWYSPILLTIFALIGYYILSGIVVLILKYTIDPYTEADNITKKICLAVYTICLIINSVLIY